MVGLVGPSGGGKTYSALRLATGIQRVTGGDIFHIDTESRRALHYADRFKFRHVPFGAPFGSLDYLAAVEHAVSRGAKVIVVDSMSHEHEGPGGLLEAHEIETKRLAKAWKVSEYAAQMSAWDAPKRDRRRMINGLLQLPISAIFCFRAKEKIKIVKGEDPKPLGYMAIAGEEFMFEMALNCLLLPAAGGVPTWQSREIGERATMKLPEQFKPLFAEPAPLSEDIGEALAQWAEGVPPEAPPTFADLAKDMRLANTVEELATVGERVKVAQKKRSITGEEIASLKEVYKTRQGELGAA